MTTLIKAVGSGKLLSKSAASQQVEDLSKGLPGAPTQIGYGLGIAVAGGWVLQNPVFNGYAGIAAYLPSQKLSIVIDNTHGPNANAGHQHRDRDLQGARRLPGAEQPDLGRAPNDRGPPRPGHLGVGPKGRHTATPQRPSRRRWG